jgi:hypothetical protein
LSEVDNKEEEEGYSIDKKILIEAWKRFRPVEK